MNSEPGCGNGRERGRGREGDRAKKQKDTKMGRERDTQGHRDRERQTGVRGGERVLASGRDGEAEAERQR